jgi:hypothetical protein
MKLAVVLAPSTMPRCPPPASVLVCGAAVAGVASADATTNVPMSRTLARRIAWKSEGRNVDGIRTMMSRERVRDATGVYRPAGPAA